MAQKKKGSIIRNFLITLFFGCLLVGASILNEKAPEKIDNFIEENLNISATNTSSLITVNTIGNTPVTADSKLSIYYLDVGQGDASLIVADDQTMLIDGGNNEDGDLIVNYIQGLGISKIDYVIATHPHEDHIGGLDSVINSFEIGKVYMPQITTTTSTFQDLLTAIQNKGLSISKCEIGNTFGLGDGICTIMYVDNEENENFNNNSIVLNLTYGEKTFLFMGDAEEAVEQKVQWQHADVIKLGHHGSSSSSSEKFLKAVKPETAIISCGKNNDYGHPHKEILDRLNKLNIKTYRTDTDGTILLSTDGKTIEITTSVTALDGNSKTNSLVQEETQE